MPGGVYHLRTCVDCQATARIQVPRASDRPPARCQLCSGLRRAAHLPPTTPRPAALADPVAVRRLLTGEHPARTTPTERVLAAQQILLADPRMSAAKLARRLGVSTRTANRYRSEIRRYQPEPSTST